MFLCAPCSQDSYSDCIVWQDEHISAESLRYEGRYETIEKTKMAPMKLPRAPYTR